MVKKLSNKRLRMENIFSLTEAKSKFSDIINRIIYRGDKITITKKSNMWYVSPTYGGAFLTNKEVKVMGRVHDLTEEQQKLQDQIFFLDETDEDYKEQFEAIMSKQLANSKSLEHILEYLSDVLLELKSDATAKREVARSTQKRAITSENKYSNLKEYIYGVMDANKVNKVEGKFGSLSMRKGTMTAFVSDDFDCSQLPEFLVTHNEESWITKKYELKK